MSLRLENFEIPSAERKRIRLSVSEKPYGGVPLVECRETEGIELKKKTRNREIAERLRFKKEKFLRSK